MNSSCPCNNTCIWADVTPTLSPQDQGLIDCSIDSIEIPHPAAQDVFWYWFIGFYRYVTEAFCYQKSACSFWTWQSPHNSLKLICHPFCNAETLKSPSFPHRSRAITTLLNPPPFWNTCTSELRDSAMFLRPSSVSQMLGFGHSSELKFILHFFVCQNVTTDFSHHVPFLKPIVRPEIKYAIPNRKLILQPSISRCYVSFVKVIAWLFQGTRNSTPGGIFMTDSWPVIFWRGISGSLK